MKPDESLVGEEASEWLLRAFGWALQQFGGTNFYERTLLVTPTSEHFPERPQPGEDPAVVLFRQVRAHAGMESWPCKLVAQKPDIDTRIAPTIVLENVPRGPGGTFSEPIKKRAPAVITYNPSDQGDAQWLAAVFAHELAHYLGREATEAPPGGTKNWENATDLLAVFMGFGIFLANSAVRFGQFAGVGTRGWKISRTGYLTDVELIFALAIFCILKGIDQKQARGHLKPWLRSALRDATDELGNRASDIEKLRNVVEITRPPSRHRLRRWSAD